MVPYSAFMKLEKMDYQRLLDTICTLLQRLVVLLLQGIVVVQLLKSFKKLLKNYQEDMILIGQVSADEVSQGIKPIWVFLICLGFVYLVLAAQYESFILPLSVILSLPAGIFAFLLKLTGLENNIYAQVAMVMLIGIR
jgi:HAE1 family hydrophobic/amphiphilic exporter-1